jgi:redox-sensitive bicupin YhaK (pirin superfamily)
MITLRRAADRGHADRGWLNSHHTFSFSDYYDPKWSGYGALGHGELQLMSAGSGITHSEMNASHTDVVHFLQIWITPAQQGVAPGYQQQMLNADALRAGFTTVVAPAAEQAAFAIHQDARVDIAWPAARSRPQRPLDPQRRYYLHVARGDISANGEAMRAGDAAMFENESSLQVLADSDAELLLFDLP